METGKQNFSLAAVERVAELFGMSGSELIAAAEGTQRVPLSRHILAQQKFGALSTRLERLRRELERVCDEPRALTILEKQEGQEP
jgi:hypothetical protein